MVFCDMVYAILQFQMVSGDSGHHMEHALKTFVVYLYAFNKPNLWHLGVIFEIHCYFSPR